MTDASDEDYVDDEGDLVGVGQRTFWWEKTVEFLFARAVLRKATISPLSGAIEQYAGDAFFRSADNFGIIEFKASIDKAESERKKFVEPHGIEVDSYTDYLPHIQSIYRNKKIVGHEPHVLIYGLEKEERLAIRRVDYWRRWLDSEGCDKEVTFKVLPAEAFDDYLRALAQFKKPPKRSKFRGGSVFGVSEGRIVSQIALDFLIDSLGYFPRPSVENTVTHGPRIDTGP